MNTTSTRIAVLLYGIASRVALRAQILASLRTLSEPTTPEQQTKARRWPAVIYVEETDPPGVT